jgi:hypothetical protein
MAWLEGSAFTSISAIAVIPIIPAETTSPTNAILFI